MSGNPSLPGATATRGRRWPRRLLGVLLVLLVGAGLALWQHERWLEPWLVGRAREYVRRELGAELTVGRLRLTRAGAELEGVRWRAPSGPLRELADARIVLATDWRAELRGEARRHWAIEARGIALELGGSEGSQPAGELPALGSFVLAARDVTLSGALSAPIPLEQLDARGALLRNELELESLVLTSGPNRARLSAARANLLATPRATLDSLRGELALELADLTALPAVRDWPLESLELALTLAEGHTSLSGRIGLTTGQLVIERGELRHAGRGSWRDLDCSLALSADVRDLAPFARWVGRPLAGRWSGAVEVSGPLAAPVGRFLGRGEQLVVDGLALDSAELDLETDGERVRLTTCRASGPAFRGHASGELALQPLELVELVIAARADGPALASVLPFPAQRAFLAATLNGPPEALDGTFEASLSGAELMGTALEDAEARGTFVDGAIHFDELTAAGAGAELVASGSLARAQGGWRAELGRLELAWGDLACTLEHGARALFGQGRFELEKVVLLSASKQGTGRAELGLRHDERGTQLALTCERFDAGSVLSKTVLGGWSLGQTSGTLDYTRDAQGERARFDLGLEAEQRGRHAALGLALRVRGRSEGGRLEFEQLEVTRGDELRLAGSLALPFERARALEFLPGELSAELELTGNSSQSLQGLALALPELAHGPFRAHVRLDGSWQALVGEARLDVEQLVLDPQGLHPLTARLALELGETLRPTLEFEAPEGRVHAQGTLGIAADLPALLDDPARLLEAPLELAAELELAELAWLSELVPDLRRISGSLRGRLSAGGTVQDPTFGGALTFRDGELRLTRFATPLRALSGDFHLEDDVIHVDALSGELGGAPVRVSGTLEPFGPFTRLDLRVQGENVLLARSSRLRLRADADLELSGSPELLSVGGELRLTEGLYESEFDILKEILRAGRSSRRSDGKPLAFARTGNLARTVFDVHVTSRRRFRFQTNVLSADLRPDAWLRGTGASPTVEGPVYVDAAELVLPSGKLQLESGLLTFRPERPFRPDVTLTAAMRVQRHDVRALVSGDLDELTVTPSSTPPLATDDLWVLILTGQPPTERWQDRSAAAMESLAVFLARDSFVRWFGGDQEGLLDRFELEVGARTTQSGQPTGRVLFYMKPRRIDSRRATYLSAEIDEYERVNYALGIVFRPR